MAEDIADRLKRYLATGGFQQFLNIELIGCDAKAGTVEVRLPWKPEFERGPGTKQWHGGPMAALIDIVGDFALIAMVGRGLPTIDLRIDYLRPAIDTDLFAAGRTSRAGKSIGFADVEVKDKAGRVVALGRGAYSTLPPQS
ncbi:MAG: PaaI family thioesterase [Alphaproteobacteria bacterium]|nr:PaaI family thioesterase [Alphaproteobacteria bacterium]